MNKGEHVSEEKDTIKQSYPDTENQILVIKIVEQNEQASLCSFR